MHRGLSAACATTWWPITWSMPRAGLTRLIAPTATTPRRWRLPVPSIGSARLTFSAAERGRSTIHVPVAVLFEVILLEHAGRLRISYQELRDQLSLRPALPLVPVTPDDVDEARTLGALDDPFDRLIVGTAIRLGLPLITNDEPITRSKRIRTFW